MSNVAWKLNSLSKWTEVPQTQAMNLVQLFKQEGQIVAAHELYVTARPCYPNSSNNNKNKGIAMILHTTTVVSADILWLVNGLAQTISSTISNP